MYAMYQKKTQSKHNNSKIIQKCQKQPGRTSFKPKEDLLLCNLVKASDTANPNWQYIASQLGGDRSARQCRERWNHYLSPAPSSAPWTADEEARLIDLVQEIGTKFAALTMFFPNRTESQLKNKYKQIKRKRTNYSLTRPDCMIVQPIPDALEMNGSARSTTCALSIIDFADFEFTSGDGFHAEEKAVEFAKKIPQIADGILPENVSLFFQPSKSPCTSQGPHPTRTDGKPGCKELIEALDGTTINGSTFHCSMGATKPYHAHMAGGKQASIDAYNNSSVPHAGFVRT